MTGPILKTIRDLLFAGTDIHAPSKLWRPIVIINSLALLTATLVLWIGTFIFFLSGSVFVIIGVFVECSALMTVVYLNKQKRHFIANILTLLIHCVFALYFGALLGVAMPVDLITIFLLTFLVGASFLVYKERSVRLLAIVATAILFLLVTANNYYHVVRPIEISASAMPWIKNLSVAGMVILIGFMMYLVISQMDLYRNELDRTIVELDRANGAKTKYLNQTTHEIRNPLNAVMGFAEVLLLRDPGDEDVKNLYTAATYCREVINDTLDMAKIEAGKFAEVKNETFHLWKCLVMCKDMNAYIAEGRGMIIKLALDMQLPDYIVSDLMKVKKIINNLLSNATKFGDEGSEVWLGAHQEDSFIKISVKNKANVSPEVSVKMFEPFESEQNGRYAGTGLGLVITKQLVEQLGGQIKTECDGRQLTISCMIPLTTGREEDAAKTVISYAPGAFSGVKILAIDDNQLNRMILERLLVILGVEPVMAEDGRGIFNLLEKEKPHLILLDWHLLHYSGREILELLKRSPNFNHIPIAIISGDSFAEEIEVMIEAGAQDYLSKPITVAGLFHVISKHFPMRNIAAS